MELSTLRSNTLRRAIEEAKRFIYLAEIAEAEYRTKSLVSITGNKHTGAAKRASMDLTRVLADFRQGR